MTQRTPAPYQEHPILWASTLYLLGGLVVRCGPVEIVGDDLRVFEAVISRLEDGVIIEGHRELMIPLDSIIALE